jgi:hypothetical protein
LRHASRSLCQSSYRVIVTLSRQEMVMKTKKTSRKPFGIELLQDIPAEEMQRINGGRRHHKHHGGGGSGSGGTGSGGTGGGVFTTQYVSAPQKAFPHGDHG